MSLVYRVMDPNTNRTIVSGDLADALSAIPGWYEDPPREIMIPVNAMMASGRLEQEWVDRLLRQGIQLELLKLDQAIDGLRGYQRQLSIAQDAAHWAQQQRNEYILMLRKAGASVASMTEPLGMSRAQVDRIANPKE